MAAETKVFVSIAVLGCFFLGSIAADEPISPEGKEAVVQQIRWASSA